VQLTYTFALAAALIISGSALATMLRKRPRRLAAYGTFSVAVLGVAVILWPRHESGTNPPDIVSMGLARGYVDPNEWSMKSAPRAVQRDNRSLPSVPAMIARLENRLATTPGDAKGWSLLAQSYAYIGNRSGVETAVASAVALGVDERSLRAQVAVVENEALAATGQ
jgi:cytochrome c-type biogenesis protein CcmH/NrfG